MILRRFALALALLVPSSALATPISVGVWSSVPSPGSPANLQVAPFWAGLSWDCATCGIGYLLDADGYTELEYLHDGNGRPVGFTFPELITSVTVLHHITAWTDGTFGQLPTGDLWYNSGTGHNSTSSDGTQWALFRQAGELTTRYIIGVEDILISSGWRTDQDYNDYVGTFVLDNPPPVPEPATLMLVAAGAVGLVLRKRRLV
jgi:PEP-CTERM motif